MNVYKKKLTALAVKYNINDIYVFGSRAPEIYSKISGIAQNEVQKPDSDVDVAVKFRNEYHPALKEKISIAGELENIFNSPVDLIDLDDVNTFFKLEALKGELLYCDDENRQANYELYVMRRAGDLAHFEKQRRKIILKGQSL